MNRRTVLNSLAATLIAAAVIIGGTGCSGSGDSSKTVSLEEFLSNPIKNLSKTMVPIPGKDYSVCKYEVTQALWEAVMGENPSEFKDADHPVDNVSWDDCQEFLKKLNARPEVAKSGVVYRLPTADEWEYACRAGGTGKYGLLADGTEGTLDEMGWYKDNSGNKTHPVGQKKANAFGLYDMHGNVCEWTSTAVGVLRVNCGGGWGSNAGCCESDRCGGINLDDRYYGLGFRLALGRAAQAETENPEATQAEAAVRQAIPRLPTNMVPIPGKNYSICKYEVTQALWEAVMGGNPSRFEGADFPVERVSWNDCQEFIENLNALPEVKASGVVYRLPTADEWEYACRAGSPGKYGLLADGTEGTLDEMGWYLGNSGHETHPVGQKKPNAFGLYDMHGNVLEWTSTADGDIRDFCGGGWDYGAVWCEADYRAGVTPSPYYRDPSLGFRLASVSAAQAAAAEREAAAAEAARQEALSSLPTDMVPVPGKDYGICKYEVTQALWEAVMGGNPSRFEGADLPVEQVSWDDCQEFIEKLNALPEVKASGVVYRLPTANEWDYACLAGGTGKYGLLADGTEGTLDEMGWYEDNSGGETHPVGQKKANAFGLYDMHGNVWEWTSTADGGDRVNCGGSWNDGTGSCEADYRNRSLSDSRNYNLGFRLASVSVAQAEAAKQEAVRQAVPNLPTNMVPISGKDYSICKYEVTQALWEAVMGGNPSEFKGADRPVENVSWDDCQEFIEKLNALPEVKASGVVYRLPTKYEWGYACRAGSTGKYGLLANGKEGTLDEMGWYDGNSGGKTHPVGQKKPNAFGLYDMHGNVREWTSTAAVGYDRVDCGGSWGDGAGYCEAGNRDGSYLGIRRNNFGFRLASVSAAQAAAAKREAEAARQEALSSLPTNMVPIPGKNYSICKYEVTQALWEAVMGYNPSGFEGADLPRNPSAPPYKYNPSGFEGADLPVENVTWDDCQEFIEKLNALPEVKASGVVYRLPTAGEWEYACRAGGTGKYGLLADGTEGTLDEMGWYGDNSGLKTHPVGKKKPNAFGLYDMHGNVWEWTSTAVDYDLVHCGGSWISDARDCEADDRTGDFSYFHNPSLGFRLASRRAAKEE